MSNTIIPNFSTSSNTTTTTTAAGTSDFNNRHARGVIHKENNYFKKKYECCCKGGITADQVLTVLAAITITATIVAVIFAIVFASRADSLQRFSIRATSEAVVGGPAVAEPGAFAVGIFGLYSVERKIEYFFRYQNVSTITAIHVMGPITTGSGEIGPFKFALCGSPSTTVCDVTTTPGLVGNLLDEILPGATSPRPEINAIRENPTAYYLEFLTNDNPITPGALRGNLDSLVGTP